MTQELEIRIRKNTEKIGIFQCFEVTVNRNERIDFLTYQPKQQIWRSYEIKSSKSDFYSKSCHTFLTQFNYYVMHKDLYEQVKHDIPKEIGCYILCDGLGGFYCIKNPKKQKMRIDEIELKENFIRSLSRDANKYNKLVEKDIDEIDKVKREKSGYKSRMNKALRENKDYVKTIKEMKNFIRKKGLYDEYNKL